MFLGLHFLVLYFIAGIPSLHMFTRGAPATPANRIVLWGLPFDSNLGGGGRFFILYIYLYVSESTIVDIHFCIVIRNIVSFEFRMN